MYIHSRIFPLLLICVLWSVATGALAQPSTIKGRITELLHDKEEPIIGAVIKRTYPDTLLVSDEEGRFSLHASAYGQDTLIVSHAGFESDTIFWQADTTELNIVLFPRKLSEVTIKSSSTSISKMDTRHTEILTSKELQKAPCCNLSESFSTNASVDVSFSDAVSGAKQIQMLGLDGIYTQMLTENIPLMRGLGTTFGLNYIPGTWISSIRVGKGAGSVVNGYESTAGQINIELKKPELAEKFFFNGYVNHMGRAEGNLTMARKLNERWYVGLLTHGSLLKNKLDMNKDSFTDLPLFDQVNVLNRWHYEGKGIEAHFGVKMLHEGREAGQFRSDDFPFPPDTKLYENRSRTKRVEVFSKLGILFPKKPYKGIGIISSAVLHDQQTSSGLRDYQGLQKSFYTNVIYQSIIGTTDHQFKVGASYMADMYNEALNDSLFSRIESVPGVFGEYTFTVPDKFSAVIGLRADHHNMFGNVLTPRLHLKYIPWEHTTVRVSAGRGFRTANLVADNLPLLVSSRVFDVQESPKPETAWNYGLSFVQDFYLFERKGTFSTDFFRTDFINRIVVDLDNNAQKVSFYNLKGQSYANSFQVQLDYEPLERLNIRLAYKYYDVMTDYKGTLLQNPLIPKQRALLNMDYALPFEKWKFDFTVQWLGRKRLPNTSSNPVQYRFSTSSPSYFILNTQITRAFRTWDLYVGGENLTGFRQKQPILGTDDPFGTYFDASMVWGPIVGSMVYAGFRWKIK